MSLHVGIKGLLRILPVRFPCVKLSYEITGRDESYRKAYTQAADCACAD